MQIPLIAPDIVLQNAAAATGNGTSLPCGGYPVALLWVTGSFSATVTFEGSPDHGTTWAAIMATSVGGDVATTATATGVYQITCSGLTDIRARISSYASGSVTVQGHCYSTDAASKIVTLATGTKTVGAVTTTTNTTGGASKFQFVNSGVFTKQAIKASAGTLYGLLITNAQAAATFVQIFDVASGSVTPGTTVPDLEISVGANAALVVPLPLMGVAFGTAITLFASTAEGGGTGSAAGVKVCALYA